MCIIENKNKNLPSYGVFCFTKNSILVIIIFSQTLDCPFLYARISMSGLVIIKSKPFWLAS